MEYMTIKEAADLWNISERRIRQLIQDGRIAGSIKVGTTWSIPKDANKPIDKRIKIEDNFKVNIPKDFFEKIDNKKKILDSKRPIPTQTLKSLRENYVLEWTYNSNAIEGNTLTLKETKVVLEGITVGGKSLREHLEAINHKEAIDFLEKLVSDDNNLSEFDIKNIHSLVLKGIDNENAGKYRIQNVIISGAKHTPPESVLVPEQNNQTLLLADVKNETTTESKLKLINITLYDKSGNQLVKLSGIIGPLKAGESTQLNVSSSLNYANAYDFKIENQ